jgi:RNA polymerase sigma-70 factor (ECF subfamily)
MSSLEQVEKDVLAIARSDISDETIINQVKNNDVAAWEIIMRRHNQRLFRVARSILPDDDSAQDAMQESYISAYYKLDHYQDREKGSFTAWLTRITINEALMIKRKQKPVSLDYSDTGEDIPTSPQHEPEKQHANLELARLIEKAIDCLPDEFRSVFMLRAIQQCSTRETADSLSLKEATVKSRYHRARGLMQQELDQHIRHAGLQTFEFAGKRCDGIVERVMSRLMK